MIKMIIKFVIIAVVITAITEVIVSPIAGMPAPSFFADIAKLSGTLLGFTITGLSILVAFSHADIINELKKTGHFKNLSENIYLTGFGFFASMIAGLISIFTTNYLWWLFTLTAFIFSLVCLFNAGRKFYQVIKLIGVPKGNLDKLE